jgi:hypothetical protein
MPHTVPASSEPTIQRIDTLPQLNSWSVDACLQLVIDGTLPRSPPALTQKEIKRCRALKSANRRRLIREVPSPLQGI